MTFSAKHKFTSPKSDSADTTLIRPSNWNDEHEITMATDRILGRDTLGAGTVEELIVTGGLEFTGLGGIQRSALTGDVTAAAGSNTLTIADDAVTYAKFQNISTNNRVLGRSTTGVGDVEEISIGTGLTLSGGTLSVTASTYQPLDADLTAIAALAGTSGLLKKTAADTWTLDTTTYAPLASPTFTGTPAGPTAAVSTNTTQLATTAFVIAQGNATAATIAMNGTQAAGTSSLFARADHVHPTDTSRAPLASPTFTGTPAAPTAVAGTNTTQIATTAFVQGALGGYQPLDADLTAIAALAGTSGILTKTAANTWSLDTNTYLTTTAAASAYQPLDADLTSIAGLAGTTGVLKKTAANTWALDTTVVMDADIGVTVQAYDADLGAIAALAGTSGLLKKTAANTWALDTTAYAPLASPTFTGTVTAPTLSLTTALSAADGGTGQTSYTVGDILYASTTSALSKLADVATGNVLISGGVGVAPSWGKVGLTTHVSGTLAVANGGTGTTTSTGTGANVLAGSPTFTGTVTIPTLSLTTALSVRDGGTGATSLTGILKGNGTGAFTAATANTDYLVNAHILLATLTTTSGTTQTASGLSLTTYRKLFISLANVSHNGTGFTSNLTINGASMGVGYSASGNNAYIDIDLLTGVGTTFVSGGSIGAAVSTVTTADTSLAFTWSGGYAFDLGTIRIYGVK